MFASDISFEEHNACLVQERNNRSPAFRAKTPELRTYPWGWGSCHSWGTCTWPCRVRTVQVPGGRESPGSVAFARSPGSFLSSDTHSHVHDRNRGISHLLFVHLQGCEFRNCPAHHLLLFPVHMVGYGIISAGHRFPHMIPSSFPLFLNSHRYPSPEQSSAPFQTKRQKRNTILK